MSEEEPKFNDTKSDPLDPETALKELRERVELGDEEDEGNW